MWFVYILRSRDGRFYTGSTNNIERRFKEHQSGRGGKFTKAFGAEELLYQEEVPTRQEALRREAQIKRWSRKRKELLI